MAETVADGGPLGIGKGCGVGVGAGVESGCGLGATGVEPQASRATTRIEERTPIRRMAPRLGLSARRRGAT